MNIFADWLTIPQAVTFARSIGKRLERQDLTYHCRLRYGQQGLAVFIDATGIHPEAPPYQNKRHRGIWLIHHSALMSRLEERERPVGRPPRVGRPPNTMP